MKEGAGRVVLEGRCDARNAEDGGLFCPPSKGESSNLNKISRQGEISIEESSAANAFCDRESTCIFRLPTRNCCVGTERARLPRKIEFSNLPYELGTTRRG